MKIKTFVIDDEPYSRKKIINFLKSYPQIIVVGELGSGQDALMRIKAEKPDLLFLDVEMPDKNGFEIVTALDGFQLPCIILVTAYDKYAVQAFEIPVLDYLLKPYDRDRFAIAMSRVIERFEKPKKSLPVKSISSNSVMENAKYPERMLIRKNKSEVILIKTNDIEWIKSRGNYLEIHIGKDIYLVRNNIGKFERNLDPSKFIRIHRSFIVKLDCIVKLRPMYHKDHKVILTDGSELIISRNHWENIRPVLSTLKEIL